MNSYIWTTPSVPDGGRTGQAGSENRSSNEAECKSREHLQLIMADLPSIEAPHLDFFQPA
jgi:hypothetical protein